MKFDTGPLLAGLDELNAEAGKAVRPAAAAGAVVLHDEAKIRCPVSDKGHYFYGKNSKKTGTRYYFQSGNLRNSIYRVYSRSSSQEGKQATYHIAWNHQKAPYGFMVEFGTSKAAAHPFLRPAYDAMSGRALAAARDTFNSQMRGAISELK